jgi:hypothetical protein
VKNDYPLIGKLSSRIIRHPAEVGVQLAASEHTNGFQLSLE